MTDNGVTSDGFLAVDQGDLVFIKVGSSYGWHLVTTAGNLSSDATENTAFIDDGIADPAIVALSQMSEVNPGAQEAVSATTALSFGDIIFAKTTANASNNNAYNFHFVTGADAVNGTGLRFDNSAANLTVSTAHVITMGVGLKDRAGNALASQQTISFTTGANSGTNNTPPFVQSSQPNGGSQTHPINAPIKLTFSVDMASSGSGDVTSANNIGLFTDVNGVPTTAITTTKAYDSASKTVTLTPSAVLTASTGYIVKVNTTATSTTSAALLQPYFLFFKTPSGAADTTAPTVLGASPSSSTPGAGAARLVLV